jgi:hypothetical protein
VKLGRGERGFANEGTPACAAMMGRCLERWVRRPARSGN